MAWYETGTVNVTLNSAAVTGVGTQWVAGARQGEAFVGPDGRLYEVLNISSNTALTLTRPYRGPTQAAQPYALAPFQGYVKELADRAATLLASMQTDYATVLKQADLQDPLGAPTQGKVLRTDTFGLGSKVRAWVAGASAADQLWVKVCTITAQANQRGSFTIAGGSRGYGAADAATTGVGVINATMGNGALENNLNLEYLYSNNPNIVGLKTVRISTWKFELWVRTTAYTKLVIGYVGDFSTVEPHWSNNTQAAAPDSAFHWETHMYPIWTGRTLNPANIGATMGLKSAAFADLIGDVGAGAAMQSGSNANGRWWRFHGGLQICEIDYFDLGWADLQLYSMWGGASKVWMYPITFVSGTRPTVASFVSHGWTDCWISPGAQVTAAGVSVRLVSMGRANVSVFASLAAVGRWK